jgi:hypothetical protein
MEAALDTYKEIKDEMETSGETEAVLERQELRKEEMNMDAVRPMEDRHKGQRLKIRRGRQPRKRVQVSVGSRQKFATARRRKLHCAVPAVLKDTYVRVRAGTVLHGKEAQEQMAKGPGMQ